MIDEQLYEQYEQLNEQYEQLYEHVNEHVVDDDNIELIMIERDQRLIMIDIINNHRHLIQSNFTYIIDPLSRSV